MTATMMSGCASQPLIRIIASKVHLPSREGGWRQKHLGPDGDQRTVSARTGVQTADAVHETRPCPHDMAEPAVRQGSPLAADHGHRGQSKPAHKQ